jgi:hypothetical protein
MAPDDAAAWRQLEAVTSPPLAFEPQRGPDQAELKRARQLLRNAGIPITYAHAV